MTDAPAVKLYWTPALPGHYVAVKPDGSRQGSACSAWVRRASERREKHLMTVTFSIRTATCALLVWATLPLLSLVAPAVAPAQGERIVVLGTGTPADAATINAAIGGSPEGAEIVFRGRCLINQTIRLLGHRSYRGESGAGTVLKQADGANLVALVASAGYLDNTDYTGTPVAVRHLTLDGNGVNNSRVQTAGLLLRSWLSVVEDVHIANMGGDGLRLTSRSANGTGLRNSQVNGRIWGNFIENSGRHGVHVEDTGNSVTDWTLSDNWIADSGVDGIHMENAAGWVVERNHIYGVSQHAIFAHRLFATSICDNYIEGFGETKEAGTWCGIHATVQGGAASTIADNRIFNFGGEKEPGSVYRYIAVSVNYGTGMVVVTGNAIRGAGTPRGTGLYYTAAEKLGLIVVSTGNAVEGVSTPRFIDARVTVSAGQ